MYLDIGRATLVCRVDTEDLKEIVTRASSELKNVFTNTVSNHLIILIFRSLRIFTDSESKDIIRYIDETLIFTDKFCARLKERDDILGALNTLLNPNDNDLANYQIRIRRIFTKFLQGKIITINCPENPTVGTSLPELERLLKAKEFRVELEALAEEQTISQPQYQLTYNDAEVKTNDVAKHILTCATIELQKVFKNRESNSLVLEVFKSNGILQNTETECLTELNITTTKWALEFLKLLGERHNKSQALQLLCNLNDGENQLINYQNQIHEALQKGRLKNLVKIIRTG